MNSAKAANPKADPGTIEKQIDKMVYKLYELTYEEVLVIEPDFEMSKESYEFYKLPTD